MVARTQIIAFIIIGCLCLPLYRFELGPDGISYLSIAEQYANGFWHEALNAYWGPLYSWILAILLLLRIPGIIATRLVTIGSGALALYALGRLSIYFPLRPIFKKVLLWLAALILLSFAVESNTPDLLFTALLLVYAGIIFDPDYPLRHGGAICGIMGALSFYTKSYGFVFFLCHFCLFNLLVSLMRRDRLQRKLVTRQFAWGCACFFLLAGAWIFALHAKYGIWTLGTTGEFNHRLVGPQSAGYPHLRALVPPSSEHAITGWQNPSPAMLPSWSVFANPRHEVKLILRNTKEVLQFWFSESVLFPVFLFPYMGLCSGTSKYHWEWVYPVLTICLFSAGYVFLAVESRYLWFADLLMLLIAFRCLDLFFEGRFVSTRTQTASLAILVLSFAVGPLRILRGHFKRDVGSYAAAQMIKASGKLKAPFASCESWAESAYVAYVVHEPYDGVVAPEPDADEIARALNPDFHVSGEPAPTEAAVRAALSSAHIENLLVWPDCPVNAASLGSITATAGEVSIVHVSE